MQFGIVLFCYCSGCFPTFYILKTAEAGEIYTWGWKECVPSSKVVPDMAFGGFSQKDMSGRQSSITSEQGMLKIEDKLHLLQLSSAKFHSDTLQ